MTAVMRLALARFTASIMINSSMRLWLAGGQVDWIRKTSRPRTFSPISTRISPSLKALTSARPRVVSRWPQIFWASSGLALPVKIRGLLLGMSGEFLVDGGMLVFHEHKVYDW